MNPVRRRLPSHTTVEEEQAEQLRFGNGWYPVKVHPPRNKCPETLTRTIRGVLELQTKWFGLRNTSPTAAYEIRRTTPDNLEFQFALPTKRLERKLRTHLKNAVPSIEFEPGNNGLPVTEEESIGGGLLTTGRKDWYPLRTDFDHPPANSLASALHRHAMQDTKIIVQVLFRPVIGQPLRSWWRTRRTYQRIGHLRREKEKLWGSRPPTPREKQQADALEQKAGTTRFHTSIRLLIIGAGEYTPSRVKELAGGFNIYENPDTGQYLNAKTIHTPFTSRFIDFADAVRSRRFAGWHHRFHSSVPELAGLVSIPDRTQQNITYAQR
jgi:hypothetical protein